MRTLRELRDSIDHDAYDRQLGRVVQELIDHVMRQGESLILYYPAGQSTLSNGEVKDNCEIAREILTAARSGTHCDLALPTGWELKPLGAIVDAKEAGSCNY